MVIKSLCLLRRIGGIDIGDGGRNFTGAVMKEMSAATETATKTVNDTSETETVNDTVTRAFTAVMSE